MDLSSTPGFEVEIIWGEEKALTLEHAWRDLFEVNYIDSPFCRFEWFWHWWFYLGKAPAGSNYQADLLTIVVRHGGEIVAIAPFHFEKGTSSTIGPRLLRPVGVLGQRYSDLTEEPILLLKRGLQCALIEPIKVALNGLLRKGFDGVQLHYIDMKPQTSTTITQEGSMMPKLKDLLKAGECTERIPMLSLSLPHSHEEFVDQLSAKNKDHLRRKPKKMSQLAMDWKVIRVGPGRISQATDELVYLHRIRNTKDAGRTTHIRSQAHRVFCQNVFAAYTDLGIGDVFLLVADGKPISAQAVLFGKNEWLLLHAGHDPAFNAASPTFILQAEIFRQAIEGGAKSIRLHRFAQEWKIRWGAEIDSDFCQWISIKRNPLSLARQLSYAVNRKSMDSEEGISFTRSSISW